MQTNMSKALLICLAVRRGDTPARIEQIGYEQASVSGDIQVFICSNQNDVFFWVHGNDKTIVYLAFI